LKKNTIKFEKNIIKIEKNTLKFEKNKIMTNTTKPKRLFKVDIDFDYSSKCWNMNKTKMGKGVYVYKKLWTKTKPKGGKTTSSGLKKE